MPTLKVYQVCLNKDKNELNKLDFDIIKLDIEYFIKKLFLYYHIQIAQYSFGLITSKAGFDKFILNEKNDENLSKINEKLYCENLEKSYKNYPIMKKHCNDNNYEFIIFNRENNKFYTHEKTDKLKNIKITTYINPLSIIKVNNIYQGNDFDSLKKLYINKNDISFVERIKSLIKDDDLSIKLIGKFKSSSKIIPKFNEII